MIMVEAYRKAIQRTRIVPHAMRVPAFLQIPKRCQSKERNNFHILILTQSYYFHPDRCDLHH